MQPPGCVGIYVAALRMYIWFDLLVQQTFGLCCSLYAFVASHLCRILVSVYNCLCCKHATLNMYSVFDLALVSLCSVRGAHS